MKTIVLAAGLLLLDACSRPQKLAIYSAVPDFTLTASSGQEFRSADQLKGKVWIADFIFTTCTGPCPRLSSQMQQVQQALRDLTDVRLVSFTVDPDRDTPEALSAYAKRYAADPQRWFFLTGAKESLEKLSLQAFLLNGVGGTLDHSTRFSLVDRAGRIRKYYTTSDDFSISAIVADVKALLLEPAG